MSRLLVLISLVLGLDAVAQNLDWQPIPYQQTNYYKIQGTSEFFPMTNDYWMPGGVGDFFGIHEQFLQNEFDSCAWAIWWPETHWNSTPKADFRMFVNVFGTIRVMGMQDEFYIPLRSEVDSLVHFSQNKLIKLDSQRLEGNDSVKYFSIIQNDSATQIGHITLSKHVGLISFTSFRDLENSSASTFRTLGFVGATDSSGTSVGVTIPDRQSFLPYTTSDELFIEYKYWDVSQAQLTPITEYHHLMVDSIFNTAGEAEIIAHAIKYDSQYFYLATTPDYRLKLEPMLQTIVTKKASVPMWSDSDFQSATLFANSSFSLSNDSGVVATIAGQETGFCDSNMTVDGHGQTEIYSSAYGLLYKEYHPFGPPQSWRLIAKKSSLGDYGVWPESLGISTNDLKSNVTVFPNPNSGFVNISADHEMMFLEVIDQLGRVVLRLDQPNTQIDLSALEKGLYQLYFHFENRTETRSIILK